MAVGVACGPPDKASDGGEDEDGGPGVCGDGNKDPGELCDDGNLIAGDGCSPECMPSGMPYDCVDLFVLDDPDHKIVVFGFAPLADGTFVLGGSRDEGAAGRHGWVARFDASGAQRWYFDMTTLDPKFSSLSLAGSDQAGLWTLASNGQSHDDAPRIVRFDLDGKVTNTVTIESEPGLNLVVRKIEVTAAGVWMVGELWENAQGDAWLGLYDPAQDTVKDVLRIDHLGYNDVFNVVTRDGEGVAVAGTVSTTPNHDGEGQLFTAETDILVAWVDVHGDELRRTMIGPSPDPKWLRSSGSLVVDGGGRWFVGGSLSPASFGSGVPYQSWIEQIDGPWSLVGDPSSDTISMEDGVVRSGVFPAPDEVNYHGWVSELGSDGVARWEFREFDEHHRPWDLAHDAAGSIRMIIRVWGPEPKLRSCLIAR
jgi:cysteine-rich repeat protein